MFDFFAEFAMFPYRIRFTKLGRLRFLSHHDLMRLFERALRRSGLPLKMTEGFNPHPKIAMPVALGIGIESKDEVLEFELETWVSPKQVEQKLAAQLPAGVSVARLEPFHRSQKQCVDFVEYEVEIARMPADIDERIQRLMASESAVVQRESDKGSKPVDVRKYLADLGVEEGRLYLRIRVTDAGTAKPEEVLELLGSDPSDGIAIRKTYTEMKLRERPRRGPRFRPGGPPRPVIRTPQMKEKNA